MRKPCKMVGEVSGTGLGDKAKKYERSSTFDPSRELEILERPKGAKRGRYTPRRSIVGVD